MVFALSMSPKRLTCPDSRSSLTDWALLMASGSTASSWERLRPRESRAPQRMRLSQARLFRPRLSTRSRKSLISLKGPPFLLASMMPLTAFSPTFWMPSSPKRILFPLTEK